MNSLSRGAPLDENTWADFVMRLRNDCVGEGVREHYTADAIFVVEAKRYTYGIDPDYGGQTVIIREDSEWLTPVEYWKSNDDEQPEIDALAVKEMGKKFLDLSDCEQWDLLSNINELTITGRDERWSYVCAHFTKDAAQAFIDRKRHDYRYGLRIYVEAQTYSWEYNAIKKAILDGSLVYVPKESAS